MQRLESSHETLWENAIRASESELIRASRGVRASSSASSGAQPYECSDKARMMGPDDIQSFRETIAATHRCPVKNVTYQYDAIVDDDNKMILNELFIVFRVKSFEAGVLTDRIVYRNRVAVPQDVQQRARSMIENSLTRVRKVCK
jgi:hypothetical protein